MKASRLYAELCKLLERGERASVVSEYCSDGSIVRHLVQGEPHVALPGEPDSALQDGSHFVSEDRAQKAAVAKEAWEAAVGRGAQVFTLPSLPGAAQEGMTTARLQSPQSPQNPHSLHNGFTLVEHYQARPRLVLLGGGHIAYALAQMAPLADFAVVVYDNRPDFANTQRFSAAQAVICDSFDHLGQHMSFCSSDYVVDVTPGHAHDTSCLRAVLSGAEPAYIGMIGSRRRSALVLDTLRQEGYPAAQLERIHTPIGLAIGAATPGEIAVAILAQIIHVRRSLQNSNAAKQLQTASVQPEVAEAIGKSGFAAQALITVLSCEGSVPTKPGSKLALSAEGSMVGTIGGGCTEREALPVARELMKTGGWRILELSLTFAETTVTATANAIDTASAVDNNATALVSSANANTDPATAVLVSSANANTDPATAATATNATSNGTAAGMLTLLIEAL